ncbi:TetR family transcriptional regulator [Kutzneria sp. 744]|uniref:TetR family transcriptional regulator n=1 Tax=Kutzneria sp. (strain 744) TaxID=345341 RepID=UPI0004ACCB0C|nr:TetR family transcriptional regulator [Kutzneria sp. 744]
MADGAVRTERAQATRDAILTAAERLFAEHGVITVSNRQISEAAGQGNNTAVGYHFGAKADLVRAIVHKHQTQIERLREAMAADAADSIDLRVWVACLVRPATGHLEGLGNPTWYARFAAQVLADPELRTVMIDEALNSPSLRTVVDGYNRCLPDLPAPIRAERDDMALHLIVQMTAERERALAENRPTPRSSWHDAATGLIDAIVGIMRA